MKIRIRYTDGDEHYFDTDTFMATDPFKGQGLNLCTEFQPRYDMLHRKEDPVFLLDVFWYDARQRENSYQSLNPEAGVRMHHAQRVPACRILLAESSEVERLASVEIDGSLVAWRQGDELINGVKFAVQEILCFSSQTTDSINEKAVSIYEYLCNKDPSAPREEVAQSMGYSQAAIDYLLSDEFASAGFDVEDDSGDGMADDPPFAGDGNLGEP